MTEDLRIDLIAIILEEAYEVSEKRARTIAANAGRMGNVTARIRDEYQEAFDTADHIIQRFDARCSKIEG